MNRLLSNLSIKMGLTLVLAIFALLIAVIALLGYQAGKQGSTSLEALDLSGDRTLALSRSQRSIAYAQLFYVSSADALEEGDATTARDYLGRAQEAQRIAQDYFAAFEATDPDSALSDTVMAAYGRLIQQGIIPLAEALEAGDNNQFNTAREVVSDLNQQLIEAVSAYNDHRAEQNGLMVAEYESDMQLIGYIDIAILVLAALIILFVRIAMVGSIVNPLNEAVAHFERIAQNDLTGNEKIVVAMRSAGCLVPCSICRVIWLTRFRKYAIAVARFILAHGKLPVATRIYRHAPSSRRHRCRKPPPAWSS